MAQIGVTVTMNRVPLLGSFPFLSRTDLTATWTAAVRRLEIRRGNDDKEVTSRSGIIYFTRRCYASFHNPNRAE